MKKAFVILFAVLATGVSAMTITLTDGRVYPNAVILRSDADGIRIRCADSTGNFFERRIRYEELSQSSFNMIQPLTTADTGHAHTLFNLQQRERSLEKKLPQEAKTEPYGNNFPGKTGAKIPLKSTSLPGIPTHIELRSLRIFGNGTIGWAESNPNFDNNVDYGRIYIQGIHITQGVSWGGNVFPTNKTVTYRNWVMPCFTTTPTAAESINAQKW